jgi:predicted transcriptional regulator
MSVEITDAERAIMEALWHEHPLRIGEIVQQVAPSRSWHRKTVSTLIRRLVAKGAVAYEEGTGGFLYFPLIDKEDYRRGEAKKLVTDLFDGKVGPLLACFAEADTLSKSELRELRKLVAKLGK